MDPPENTIDPNEDKMDTSQSQPKPATPDAPDKETMEQIRQRRLAKLGGAASTSASTSTSATATATATTPAAASATPASAAAGATKPTGGSIDPGPSSTAPEKDSETEKSPLEKRPKINISPAPQQNIAGSISYSGKRRASLIDPTSATPPPRKQTPLREESIEDYADRILSTVFRLTVDPSRTTDSYGHKLTFLPNLSQELADDGAPLKLSIDRLEEAIMECTAAFPHDKPLFDYLLPCWKRVNRTITTLRGPTPQKEDILKETKRLCFSNCIFALTMPELFRYMPCLSAR
jgi:ubiquitin conjugation factor E4 B